MKRRLMPVLIITIVLNFILFFIKFYIGLSTNCLCIYTDSVNNLADGLSGFVGVAGVIIAGLAPTKKYPFGFGKAEYISGLFMSLLMTAAGLTFAYNSLERFFVPTTLFYFEKYLCILGFTCLVKFFMGIISMKAYKRTFSPILKTISLDSFLDCAITAITIISFITASKFNITTDAMAGLLISIIITVSGIRLIVSSVTMLTDKNDEKLVARTEKEISSFSNIGIKQIIVQNRGVGRNYAYIQLNGSYDYNIQKEIKSLLNSKLNIEASIEWEEL